MKHVKKTVLLWYSPHEMYALVTDIPSYPSFLPWCARAEVLAQDERGMTARLSLAYAGVRHAFTTRNEHEPDRSVVVSLVDGPFSVLDGTWLVMGLGGRDAASGEARACRIEFELRYAFSSRALEAVVSPVFDRVANTFVDAFVKRAEQVYGAR
jgi:ribosome-associated toxin RatA of RatAB toxin-antitoxin module